MIKYLKILSPALFVLLLHSSCNETVKTTTVEEKKVESLDSSSKVIEDKTSELKEQTKKVEESLEKLDKELDTTQ